MCKIHIQNIKYKHALQKYLRYKFFFQTTKIKSSRYGDTRTFSFLFNNYTYLYFYNVIVFAFLANFYNKSVKMFLKNFQIIKGTKSLFYLKYNMHWARKSRRADDTFTLLAIFQYHMETKNQVKKQG